MDPDFSRERRRSLLEITLDIIRYIGKGEMKPTRVIYGTNISYVLGNPLLEELGRRGILGGKVRVRRSRTFRRYYLTDKGKLISDHYEQLLILLGKKEGEDPSIPGSLSRYQN